MQVRREAKQVYQDNLNWLKRLFLTYSENNGALGTAYTLDEWKDSLEHRWDVMDRLENRADSELEMEKQYREAAYKNDRHRKLKFYTKAEIRKQWRLLWENLYDQMLDQQLDLVDIVLTAETKNIMADPMEELGLKIDLREVDADALRGAVEQTNLDEPMFSETGDLRAVLNAHGQSTLGGLDEIKRDIEDMESGDLDTEGGNLAQGMEEQLDNTLEQELEQLREKQAGDRQPDVPRDFDEIEDVDEYRED